jgi:hypothetical protein
MKNTEINKLASFIALVSVCQKGQTGWSGLKAFKDKFQQFATHTAALSELKLQQESATTGFSRQKRHCRDQVCKAAAVVAGAVRAWATDQANFELAGKVDYSYSKLAHGRGTNTQDKCQVIHDTAGEHVKSLADYGVTTATLKDLQARIDAYEASLVAPREAVMAGKKINSQIASEFKAADLLLAHGLDELILGFETSDPAFHADYWNARQVVGIPATHASPGSTSNANGTATSTSDTAAQSSATEPTVPLPKAA